MENKNVVEEVVETVEEVKPTQWKIGEIVVIKDETKEEGADGNLAFVFGAGLARELNKEGNEDFKNRMMTIVNTMHELLVDVQSREQEGE